MFLSDNIGTMNVTTTLFEGNGTYLTLVTRDGMPWDYISAANAEVASRNHTTMMAACAVYGAFLSNNLSASDLN